MYAIAGIPLLIGKKTRSAAAWIGLTVLFLILVVYVPIGVAELDSLEGLNYLFDTLMFCGAVLLLALVALPVSVGIAVLRYRLYEIDKLISRTISYAILTGLLVAVFLGIMAASFIEMILLFSRASTRTDN